MQVVLDGLGQLKSEKMTGIRVQDLEHQEFSSAGLSWQPSKV